MPARSSGSGNLVTVAPPGRHLRLVSLSLVLGCVVLNDSKAWPGIPLATLLAFGDKLVVKIMNQLAIRAATITALLSTSLATLERCIRLHAGTSVVPLESLVRSC